MGEALHSISQDTSNVEIVVHVDETLEETQRDDLVTSLKEENGIHAAEFCPLRYHLMLVQYDRELMTSQDVLGKVTAQNVHAVLVGPV